VQEAVFSDGEKYPAVQSEQAEEAPAEYLPTEHWMQVIAPDGEYWPAAHGLHAEDVVLN